MSVAAEIVAAAPAAVLLIDHAFSKADHDSPAFNQVLLI
jgi:hypothetical protein